MAGTKNQHMNSISSDTLIGSYAPRQCGIATFTQDLRTA
jgi:hypothetical protein